MKIKLDLSAQLREKSGITAQEVSLPSPCTFQQSLRLILAQSRKEFRDFVLDSSGALRTTILLSLNDEQVEAQDDRKLRDGDRISMLSPIAGG